MAGRWLLRFASIVLAAGVVAAATAQNARPALFFLFNPTTAQPGDRVTVRIAGTSENFRPSQRVKPFQQSMQLFLVSNAIAAEVQSPDDARLHPIGALVPDKKGRGILTFTAPALAPDNYAIAVVCPQCAEYNFGRTFFVIHVDERNTVRRYRPLMLLQVEAPGAPRQCAASTVRYLTNAGARGTPTELPWIAGGPGPRRIVGYLTYYTGPFLADQRVNQSVGVVIPAGRSTKILWVPRGNAVRSLAIRAQLIDGPGSFGQRVARSAGGAFASTLTFPEAGCWRLTLTAGTTRATVVLEAVQPLAGVTCDALPIHPNPDVALPTPWIATTSERDGFYGLGSIQDGGPSDRATIYTGGRAVSWIPANEYLIDISMLIVGKRLDGPGEFLQRVRVRYETDGGPVFDSIVNAPTPGCWLLRLTSGKAAGVAVFRALPAP